MGVCFGGWKWYYAEHLKGAENRANNWKSDADYWKDVANRKPAAQECPSPSPSLNGKTIKQAAPAVKTESPAINGLTQVNQCPPGSISLTVGPGAELEASRNGKGGVYLNNVCLVMSGKFYVHDNTGKGLEMASPRQPR